MNKALLLLLCLMANYANAQNEFIEGKIITNDKDTIKGFIANNSYKANNNYCSFKETVNNEKVDYKPFEIDSYQFANGKYSMPETAAVNFALSSAPNSSATASVQQPCGRMCTTFPNSETILKYKSEFMRNILWLHDYNKLQ